MKEELLIERFEGIIGAADERDVPPGVATYAENLDPVTEAGLFKGLPADSTKLGAVKGSSFNLFGDGTEVAYLDGNVPKVVSNLGGSPSYATFEPGGAPVGGVGGQGVSDGKSVRFGRGRSVAPLWVGRIGTELHGLSAHLTPPPELVNEAPVAVEWTSSPDGPFHHTTRYGWGVSLIYDGFQESKLYTSEFFGWRPPNPSSKAKLQFSIPIAQNPRITHVALYRAEGEGRGSNWTPTSEYNLVDIKPWVSPTTTYVFEDEYQMGPSYERRTGISDSFSNTPVNYSLCTQLDGRLFVADARVPDQVDDPNMVFYSKPFRFDMMDWSNDYLRLPTRPQALASFAGRVFAFCEGRTYVLSGSPALEDTWEGIGCSGPNSFIQTDRGLFFANRKGAYHYDGRSVVPIGEPILKNQVVPNRGWLDASHTNPPVVSFDPARNLALFFIQCASSTWVCWAFHIDSQRWTLITLPSGVVNGAFVSSEGHCFASIGTTLYHLMGGSLLRPWRWVSHNLTDSTQPTSFYHARLVGRASGLKYREDDTWSSTISLPASDDSRVKVNSSTSGAWEKVRTFMLDVTGTATQTLRAISVIRRSHSAR